MSITIGYSNVFNSHQGMDILFGDGTQTYDYNAGQTNWNMGSYGSGRYGLPRGWTLLTGVGSTSTGNNDPVTFPIALSFVGPIQIIVDGYGGVGNPPSFYPVIGVTSKSGTGFNIRCKSMPNGTYAGGIGYRWFALGF